MAKIVCLFVVALWIQTCYGNPLEIFDDTSRIIGGTVAVAGQFPYVVSLQETSQLGLVTRGHSCSGALITYMHVLTTAFCLFNYNAATVVLKTPANYRVFAGSVNLANDTNINQTRSISTFNPHPSYLHPPSYVNNIGIIVLTVAFPNTADIQLIPVATITPIEGTECQVAGWGATSGTVIPLPTASPVLSYSAKYIYSQNICASNYNIQTQAPNILDTMVCAAAFNTNSVSCFNDTGNALVCGGQLTGVLSYFPPCVVTSWPEVYARTSNYTEWIRSITGAAPATNSMAAMVVVAALLSQIFNSAIMS